MLNPVLEGKIKMQELFDKIEQVLTENFEVINKMLVPKIQEDSDEFLNGSH